MAGLEAPTGGSLQDTPSSEISQAQFPTDFASRPSRSALWTAVLALSSSSAAINLTSCAVPPMARFSDSGLREVQNQPVAAIEALERLNAVEKQLERLEDMRSTSMVVFWPVLKLNARLNARYEEAVDRHRSLCETVCSYKEQLLLSACECSDEQIAHARDWAVKTEQDLASIFELIDYVQANGGQWKNSWTPPAGYEFIKPINSQASK